MKKGGLVNTHLLLAILGVIVAATASLVFMDALPAVMDRAIEQAFN